MRDLNKDQLDGLAKLCFDLAKVVLGVSFVPSTTLYENFQLSLIRIIAGLLIGLAFIYLALVILKLKERIK